VEKEQISAQIGERLRRLRMQTNLSLDALARKTGVSKPMLGQIERGTSNPTVATLWKIASGLGVPFTTFLADVTTTRVTRAEEQSALYEDGEKYQVYNTFTVEAGRAEGFRVRLLPGCRRAAEPHAPGVVEALVVTRGNLQMTVTDQVYNLSPGDSMQFQADSVHVYENLDTDVCEACLVIFYSVGG